MDFTYSGKWGVQKEEYNLYYMRDRYYSSELHRFLSLDKDQGDLYRPSTLNPYAYVGNASINFIDLSGMVAVEIGSAIKQVLLGDLSGEFTLVGMVARIGSSFFGFDILGDIGDLVDSLIHFDFSLEAFVNLGINTIGLLLVFGVVKNVKYVDKAIDSVKGLGKGAYQLGKRTIGGATKFALKAGVKVADYAKTGYKASSNAVGIGLNKASSFFGVSSTKRLASGADTANDARKALKNADEVGSGAKLAKKSEETVSLYRAVSPEEFYDIMEAKKFRIVSTGLSAKQFGLKLDEVLDLVNQSVMSDTAAIIKVNIYKSTYNKLEYLPKDGRFLKSGFVTASEQMIKELNNSIVGVIEHVY